jgi:hypothetical protein
MENKDPLPPQEAGASPVTPSVAPTAAEQRAWALLDDAWRAVKHLADREQAEAHPDSEVLNLRLRDAR